MPLSNIRYKTHEHDGHQGIVLGLFVFGFHCWVLLPESCIVPSYWEVDSLSYGIMAQVVL